MGPTTQHNGKLGTGAGHKHPETGQFKKKKRYKNDAEGIQLLQVLWQKPPFTKTTFQERDTPQGEKGRRDTAGWAAGTASHLITHQQQRGHLTPGPRHFGAELTVQLLTQELSQPSQRCNFSVLLKASCVRASPNQPRKDTSASKHSPPKAAIPHHVQAGGHQKATISQTCWESWWGSEQARTPLDNWVNPNSLCLGGSVPGTTRTTPHASLQMLLQHEQFYSKDTWNLCKQCDILSPSF